MACSDSTGAAVALLHVDVLSIQRSTMRACDFVLHVQCGRCQLLSVTACQADEGDSDFLALCTGPSGGVCLAGSMRSTSVQELEQAGVPARLCLLQASR